MPGTADGMPDDEAFAQWPVVVRALSPDRKDLMPVADQQDRLPAGMADEFLAIGKLREWNALSEIRAARLGLILCHPRLLCRRSRLAFALGACVAVRGVPLQELDH